MNVLCEYIHVLYPSICHILHILCPRFVAKLHIFSEFSNTTIGHCTFWLCFSVIWVRRQVFWIIGILGKDYNFVI